MRVTNNREILGVSEDATRDDITKTYRMHLKRYKNLGSNVTKEQEEEFYRVEEAYNELMGYNVKKEDFPEVKQNPVLKFFHIDQDKFDNFWLYNKTKVYVAIFVVFILILMWPQLFNRVTYDLSVAIAGEFTMEDEDGDEIYLDTSKVTDSINSLEGINSPLVNYYQETMFTNDAGTQGGLAAKQKFTTTLAAGDIDFFIIDSKSFKYLVEYGFFADLSGFAAENNIESVNLVEGTFIDNTGLTTTTVYGIDITQSDFIIDNDFYVEEDTLIIAAVCANGKNKENAFGFLNTIMN